MGGKETSWTSYKTDYISISSSIIAIKNLPAHFKTIKVGDQEAVGTIRVTEHI